MLNTAANLALMNFVTFDCEPWESRKFLNAETTSLFSESALSKLSSSSLFLRGICVNRVCPFPMNVWAAVPIKIYIKSSISYSYKNSL